MKHASYFACTAAWIFAASCGSSSAEPPIDQNPLCNFACPEQGVMNGHAAISGVPAADTFFGAVVAYQNRAEASAAELEATVTRLRAAFGVSEHVSLGSAIQRPTAKLLVGPPKAVAEEAKCFIDAARLNGIRKDCDPDFDPLDGTIGCRGACNVEVGSPCGRNADLLCKTNAAKIDCGKGLCTGTCASAWTARTCPGVCTGECTGECDRFAPKPGGGTQCVGSCNGTCTGSCANAVAAARCTGTCTGTCTATLQDPQAVCDPTAIAATCRPVAGGSFACSKECTGVFDTLSSKGECRAAANAQADFLARCDPPVASLIFTLDKPLRNATPDETRYNNALHALAIELPMWLAALARAELVQQAGQMLASAAKTDVNESFRHELEATDLLPQDKVGLLCAQRELDRVGPALGAARKGLDAAINDTREALGALGLPVNP